LESEDGWIAGPKSYGHFAGENMGKHTHTYTYIMSMYDYVYEHIMRLETLDFGVRGFFVWTKPSWISQVLTKRIKDSFKTKLAHPHFWTGLQQLQPSEAK